MGKITTFPKWKENATAAERFNELENEAIARPERFSHVVVVFVEEMKDGGWKPRVIDMNLKNDFEMVGVLHTAITYLEDRMRKR